MTKQVDPTPKQAFVARMEREHGQRLRRLVASRLRQRACEVPDLVQEVFLRLLRIDRHETIRSSEAYVYTIALHVLHQHTLREAARPEAVDITALVNEIETAPERDPASQAEVNQRIDTLKSALERLSPKAQAVLLLHRRDGYSLEEIGAKLGISRAMAAKYLKKALLHVRLKLTESEGATP